MTGHAYHRVRTGLATLAVCGLALLALTPLTSSAKTVWGISTAKLATTPGFEGYWHYQLDVSWDTAEIGGHGVSHVGFFLDLGVCDCGCNPGIIRFDSAPGTGMGVNGCELAFIGLYECRGDPHYPEKGATVKFEHTENGCEPDWQGAATLDFYSVFEPGDAQVHLGSLGIKAGTRTAEGAVVGVLPLCECGSPVERATWSLMKCMYR